MAVTSAAPSELIPGLPTIAASGLPGYELNSWFGLLAPGATPAAVVQRLHGEVQQAIKTPELRAALLADGAEPNGTTWFDRTNYFETVPSNMLERVLWLESDRMGFLLPAVTNEKFENQRATVKNERGQNVENRLRLGAGDRFDSPRQFLAHHLGRADGLAEVRLGLVSRGVGRPILLRYGRYLGVADEPPDSKVLGPVRPRKDPNGIVVRHGYIAADKLPTEDECLRQPLGLGLHTVLDRNTQPATVSEQPLEGTDIVRGRDEQHFTNAR